MQPAAAVPGRNFSRDGYRPVAEIFTPLKREDQKAVGFSMQGGLDKSEPSCQPIVVALQQESTKPEQRLRMRIKLQSTISRNQLFNP
jgi:hypothetical protein